jgi:hypothetical protein
MGRIIGIDDLPERMTLREEDFELSKISDEEEEEFRAVFDLLKNKKNWKMPTKEFTTTDLKLAGSVADVLTFFTGGAEICFVGSGTIGCGVDFSEAVITVSSKGYYHYIGA